MMRMKIGTFLRPLQSSNRSMKSIKYDNLKILTYLDKTLLFFLNLLISTRVYTMNHCCKNVELLFKIFIVFVCFE